MKHVWRFFRKIEEENLEIPAEALNYIANQIQSNIRELEGALTRLLAYSKLQGRPITTELAAEALKDIIQVPKSKKLQSKIFKKSLDTTTTFASKISAQKTYKINCLSTSNCDVFIKRTYRFFIT